MEIPSSITDKEIHNYLSEIKHQLAFTHSPKETASIMQMVESSIDDFLSEHPFATINDLSNHFGDTDEFKEMFISCAESEQLKNHLDNSQKKRKYAKLTPIPFAAKYSTHFLFQTGSARSDLFNKMILDFPFPSSSMSGFLLLMGILASTSSMTRSISFIFSCIIRRALVI